MDRHSKIGTSCSLLLCVCLATNLWLSPETHADSIVTDGDVVADGISLRDLKSGLCGTSIAPQIRFCALGPGERFVFTTTGLSKHGGNLVEWANDVLAPATFTDGLAAGDALCRHFAETAVPTLPGTYSAWLSTSAVNAKDRIGDHKWILPEPADNAVVADSVADLLNCTNPACLQHPIDESELATSIGPPVWTGTTADGQAVPGAHCDDWTSSDASDDGVTGSPLLTDSNWTVQTVIACDAPARLFCFGR